MPMRTWILVVSLALIFGCSTLDKLNPFASEAKVKPAELVPLPSSDSTSDLGVSWHVSIGKAGEYVFTPAVVGNSVYVVARDGTLARFDDGSQVWSIFVGQIVSGGVGSDGKRVVVGTPKGDVLAFDAASGKELWKARASSEVLAAPSVDNDIVAVRSGDSRIFAFEPVDGKRRWVYQRSTPALSLRSNVGVVLAGRAVLAGFPGGKLVAIATNNGSAYWESTVALPKGATELERVADITSSPVIDGKVVCAAAFQGRVSCFDLSNGNLLWVREMSSSAGLDMDSRNVYVTDDKGAVHALDRSNGASLWKQDKLFLRRLTRPIVLGRYVAVADFQGVVHLLRREDGAFAARFTTDGSAIRSEPQHFGATDSSFIVQTSNGGIYSLLVK